MLPAAVEDVGFVQPSVVLLQASVAFVKDVPRFGTDTPKQLTTLDRRSSNQAPQGGELDDRNEAAESR